MDKIMKKAKQMAQDRLKSTTNALNDIKLGKRGFDDLVSYPDQDQGRGSCLILRDAFLVLSYIFHYALHMSKKVQCLGKMSCKGEGRTG